MHWYWWAAIVYGLLFIFAFFFVLALCKAGKDN